MLSKKVAFNTSTRFIEQAGYKIKWNILCKHYMLYVIYNSSYIFSHPKTFIRTLDKVIIYMIINKNYDSNMYCCMNNKQLIKLSTP